MTVEKYKKYQQYNLMALTFSILLMFLLKDKNDLYYIGIIGFVLGMSFASWLSIQINIKSNIPINKMQKTHLWMNLFIGIPLLIGGLINLIF